MINSHHHSTSNNLELLLPSSYNINTENMSRIYFKVLPMTIILAVVLLVSCEIAGAIIHDATPNFKLGL